MGKLYKYGILIFAFSLPNFEALKYVGFFMMLAGFAGSIRWDKSITINNLTPIEWLLITILSASILSTMLNWPLPAGTKGLRHLFCFLSTFWVLYRSEPSPQFSIQIAIALMVGTLTGLIWSGCNLFFQNGLSLNAGEYELTFNLLKSVSRSGAFAASMLFVSVGMIIDNVFNFKRSTIFFSIVFLTITSAYVLIAGGRGNVLSIVVIYALLLIPLIRHKKYQKLLITQTAFVSFLIVIIMINNPTVGRFSHLFSTKFSSSIHNLTLNDQIRYDHWRIAIAQLTQNPSFFGLGPGNFKSIDIEALKINPPLLKETIQFINGDLTHGHNWLLTQGVENGIIGLGAFLAFILCILQRLWKYRPSCDGNQVNWAWVASFSAIFIASTGGLFNSSFTQENGWLTFLIIGIGYAPTIQNERLKS